jgi:hypothetical protein
MKPMLIVAMVAFGLAVVPPTGATAVDGPGIVTVEAAVPVDARAVLTNVTMVGGAQPGFVTADLCSALTDGPTSSNANHAGSDAVANLAVVPVADQGRFCLYHQRTVDLLSDVLGWIGPAGSDGLRFRPVPPSRILDTRTSAQPPVADQIVRVVTHAPDGTRAVLANIAMVGSSAAGYVAAGPCSALVAGPQMFSNGNHGVAQPVSNLSVVAVDPDGAFCIYRQRAVNLVVDVQGSFAADSAALGLALQPARRVLDTRGTGSVALAVPAAGTIERVETGAEADVEAVLVNITMVNGAAAGYVTADRCSNLTAVPQLFSNGNHPVGAAVSNLSVVPVDADGAFCIFHATEVHLVVDVQGTLSPSATDELHLVPPNRVLDTRPSTPAGTSCRSVVHIGDSTSVGLISPSILPNPADRVDAQYRRVGVTDPRTEISGARSIVERLPGQATAYEVAQAQIAAGFDGCWVFALGTTDTANVAAGSSVSRRTRIDQMMTLAAGHPVMWVNLRTIESNDPWSDAQMQAWNRELESATQRYPNLKIYDWAAAVQLQWFSTDRIHYTPEGYRQRARLIADALATLYPA